MKKWFLVLQYKLSGSVRILRFAVAGQHDWGKPKPVQELLLPTTYLLCTSFREAMTTTSWSWWTAADPADCSVHLLCSTGVHWFLRGGRFPLVLSVAVTSYTTVTKLTSSHNLSQTRYSFGWVWGAGGSTQLPPRYAGGAFYLWACSWRNFISHFMKLFCQTFVCSCTCCSLQERM